MYLIYANHATFITVYKLFFDELILIVGGYKYQAVQAIMDKTNGRDVTGYPTISDIDVDSLLVQNEYIFVQVIIFLFIFPGPAIPYRFNF